MLTGPQSQLFAAYYCVARIVWSLMGTWNFESVRLLSWSNG